MQYEKRFSGYQGVLASRLRQIMDEQGVTQATLAKETGVTRQTISQYMDGSVLPNAEKISKICVYLNVPSDYLLGFTDSTSTDGAVQDAQKMIGLPREATETLMERNHKRSNALIPSLVGKDDFIGFLLSDNDILDAISDRVMDYCNHKFDDNAEVSEATEFAGFRLNNLMQRLVDSYYIEFYKKKKPEVKQKPGRKRKDDSSNEKGAENQ